MKRCNKCWKEWIVKNWKRQGKQRYLCRICWYVWEHWNCKIPKIQEIKRLFDEYVRDDLKYRQMSQYENVNKKTIQRWLDKIDFKKIIVSI
jgi:transposase-like protein